MSSVGIPKSNNSLTRPYWHNIVLHILLLHTECVLPITNAGGTTLADSPGLAILINCGYEENTHSATLHPLPGTIINTSEMMQTFNQLNYVVCQLKNPNKAEIQALIKDVTDTLTTYNMTREQGENKVIIFAFSGHGCRVGNSEKIYANDEGTLDWTEDIILPLIRPRGVTHVPKLFLIDACLNIVPEGDGASEGGRHVDMSDRRERLTANYRIDYATIPHQISYASPGGSMWMPLLAIALREQKDDCYQNTSQRP